MPTLEKADDDGGTDDPYETVENKERGCGHLKHGKAYLRSAPAGGSGHLPAFVRFDPPVPYLERKKFRGYEFFPGVPFELSVTGGVGLFEGTGYDPDPEEPPELRSPEEVRSDMPHGVPSTEGLTETDPAGEVHRHIKRLTLTGPEGEHAGDIPAFRSHDLYQHIGASYYPTPEEFIEEVEEQGLSKAIPVSSSQEPPRINPGRTRLFLVHPEGVDEDTAGVIGYVYLHRTIYTEDKSGRFPAWAKEKAEGRSDMDLVRIGDRIYEDGKRATRIDGNGWTEIDEKDADASDEVTEAEAARRHLPDRLVPSDKPGRDVEAVPADDSNLDEDAIREQLDDAEDEIREFAEDSDEWEPEPADLREGETPDDDSHAARNAEQLRMAEEELSDDEDDASDEEGPADPPTADEEPPEFNTDPFEEASVVEVPRPDECPGCGEPLSTGAMKTQDYGQVEVRVCPSCEWANNSEVNAALVELDLREDHDYNELRSRASDRGLNVGRNPTADELVDVLLRDMGAI